MVHIKYFNTSNGFLSSFQPFWLVSFFDCQLFYLCDQAQCPDKIPITKMGTAHTHAKEKRGAKKLDTKWNNRDGRPPLCWWRWGQNASHRSALSGETPNRRWRNLIHIFLVLFFLVSFHEFQPRGDSRRCSERCCSDTRLKAMPWWVEIKRAVRKQSRRRNTENDFKRLRVKEEK